MSSRLDVPSYTLFLKCTVKYCISSREHLSPFEKMLAGCGKRKGSRGAGFSSPLSFWSLAYIRNVTLKKPKKAEKGSRNFFTVWEAIKKLKQHTIKLYLLLTQRVLPAPYSYNKQLFSLCAAAKRRKKRKLSSLTRKRGRQKRMGKRGDLG